MNAQQRTNAIVLSRVDYGEADRILTVLTPDAGKLSLIAKGARRQKSKLAGGIELFGTNEITYVSGRGTVDTLISSRLTTHYGHIVQDINRTMLGYELIKLLHKVTEDEPEREYYYLLETAYMALDDSAIPLELIRTWFSAQLLAQAGHSPNLRTTITGEKLEQAQTYEFDFDAVAFRTTEQGSFGATDIKFLRLLFSGNQPAALTKVVGNGDITVRLAPLILSLRQLHLRS